MSKRWQISLFIVLAVGMFVPAIAEQDRDNNASNGLQVSVALRHRIVIPQIIYFRIGSQSAAVAEVGFRLDTPALPIGSNESYAGGGTALGTGAVIDAASNGQLEVSVISNVSSLTLSYDLSDSQGLSDGLGNYIPFDEIDVQTSDTGLPPPVLSNAGAAGANSVTITGNLHAGRVIQRQAIWQFRYRNTLIPTAGTYEGRVAYTLSSP